MKKVTIVSLLFLSISFFVSGMEKDEKWTVRAKKFFKRNRSNRSNAPTIVEANSELVKKVESDNVSFVRKYKGNLKDVSVDNNSKHGQPLIAFCKSAAMVNAFIEKGVAFKEDSILSRYELCAQMPLHYFIEHNELSDESKYEIVNALLCSGAGPNCYDSFKDTPLNHVGYSFNRSSLPTKEGVRKLTLLLKERGAMFNKRNNLGLDTLDIVISSIQRNCDNAIAPKDLYVDHLGTILDHFMPRDCKINLHLKQRGADEVQEKYLIKVDPLFPKGIKNIYMHGDLPSEHEKKIFDTLVHQKCTKSDYEAASTMFLVRNRLKKDHFAYNVPRPLMTKILKEADFPYGPASFGGSIKKRAFVSVIPS